MYDRPFSETGYTANQLAVFKAGAEKLTYVSGLLQPISFPVSETRYMLKTASLHRCNDNRWKSSHLQDRPANASATKGVTVEATQITGIGKLAVK